MPLKAFVKNLDELGERKEALKGLYVESDGGFRLDVEGGFKTSSEIEGLTSALGKERTRADDAEKALKAIPEEIRKAPDAASKAMETVARLGDKDKEVEKRIEAAMKPLLDEKAKLTADLDSERSARRGQAKKFLFAQSKWIRDNLNIDPADAADLFGQHVHFDDQGRMFAKSEDGNNLFDERGQLAQGDDMIKALVKARYPDKKHAFYKQDSGGVAPDGRSSQGPVNGQFVMTQAQARDFTAYKKMSAMAAEKGETVTIVD